MRSGNVGVRLAELTTLRVGGPARRLVNATTEDELVAAVRAADERGEPVLLVGGGSNLLVADEGFDGTVIRIAGRGVHVDTQSCSGAFVTAAAGENWDDIVARAVAEGWVGVECLSGIPGLVGATPIQNVGAYGQEVAQTIARVRTWDRQRGELHTFAAADCGFGYRDSRFKAEPGRWVVLSVAFQFELGELSAPIRYAELARRLGVEAGQRVPAAHARETVLGLRRGKGMVLDPADHDTWSAGSFFTNPILGAAEAAGLPEDAPRFPAGDGLVKSSAAWLIDHAGFGRGFGAEVGTGAATLSTKHTLALTNRGRARAGDVLALARTIQAGVRERFGVTLVPEPVLVGCQL
ncbi:UDP-N-acetylenolpyruvoylglucosamine reductase [Enemella dayhoffiae]|uniref:UDP-N-acetylenolpyruvoylglucosamine reductase n=1 Tax=Enemella dayhoffiae TaxID=2016507 RepID=A0A255GUY6_9ACTN|nr:UDP-N-acetylmuramate dehydrogenase [Enemella dayhoffiae]OYO18403.1 UDP-N-acetylenolpyruvoylglucosamine reductase [Enemella dayhoffiae]